MDFTAAQRPLWGRMLPVQPPRGAACPRHLKGGSHPDLENPTLVVLTDRNDLDNQLFATFGRCKDLLGEEPVQAESIADLKDHLNREVGGIVFSTIQKFRPEAGELFPELTSRSNVIVLVDERSLFSSFASKHLICAAIICPQQ